MTRKDYELIAKAVADTRRFVESYYCDVTKADTAYHALDKLTDNLISSLYDDNPRFSTDIFQRACEQV